MSQPLSTMANATASVTMMQRFHEGGVFMYCILFFGLLTLVFILERMVALYAKLGAQPKDLRTRLIELIARGDLKGGEKYAETHAKSSSVARVAAVGLGIRAGGGSEEELQARMDEALASEISRVDRRTGFLAMFGNVATLLGLLGTISGMIQSFAAVANASPADRATMLSKGISEAMNCTAFGLIVAIPALVAYAVFQNRTDRFVTELTESVSAIYHDLLFLIDYEEERPNAGGPRPSRRKSPGEPLSITAGTV